MTTFDLSPLFRSTIGFDRMGRMLETAARQDTQGNGYPPYNIEAGGEDEYRITMAVAGFAEGDLDITAKDNTLTITGRTVDSGEAGAARRYLHRGIANRAFERRFQLADHIRVAGAALENGLLHVDLVREVPEALKPRTIPIGGGRKLLKKKAA